jgi:DNA-directed RNA polymerase specialized sigma24 family protein
MHSLDLRLYAWLAESDDRRFEHAFNEYFAVAFPAVVRYLARISHWDPARLEDLAQEALLRFFDRVGRARRAASRDVVSALARLRPPDPGSFRERQAQAWIRDVAALNDAAMNFHNLAGGAEAKAAIHGLVERVAMLQRQGEQQLHGARQPAEQQQPGMASFRDDLLLILEALPQLRVPTNSYLFQIAHSIYLDECKKHGRQKRGGAGLVGHPHPVESQDCGETGEPAVDPTVEYEGAEFFGKFLEYLRAPLDRAAEAYQRAAANGSALPERQRLESLGGKFTRTTAVISAIGEGHTQEQVAEQLGLSRNQVKYIIELVQDAYTRFAADADRAATSPTMREQSHVP